MKTNKWIMGLILSLNLLTVACSKSGDDANFENETSSNSGREVDLGNNNNGSNNNNGINIPLDSIYGSVSIIGGKSELFNKKNYLRMENNLEFDVMGSEITDSEKMGMLSRVDEKVILCRAYNDVLLSVGMDYRSVVDKRTVHQSLSSLPLYPQQRVRHINKVYQLSPEYMESQKVDMKGQIITVQERDGSMGFRLMAKRSTNAGSSLNQIRMNFTNVIYKACLCEANPELVGCEQIPAMN